MPKPAFFIIAQFDHYEEVTKFRKTKKRDNVLQVRWVENPAEATPLDQEDAELLLDTLKFTPNDGEGCRTCSYFMFQTFRCEDVNIPLRSPELNKEHG